MLNYLLTQEIYEDEENKVREQSDLLGGVQRNLIKSITAISAPHNDTTLTEVVTKIIPFIQYFVGVAGVVGTQFYNFDLDQWGFNRKEDETRASYINRMRTHDAWQTKNMSSWDLSLDGTQELNGFLQAELDVFLFLFCYINNPEAARFSDLYPHRRNTYIDTDSVKIVGVQSRLLE